MTHADCADRQAEQCAGTGGSGDEDGDGDADEDRHGRSGNQSDDIDIRFESILQAFAHDTRGLHGRPRLHDEHTDDQEEDSPRAAAARARR